MPDLSPDQILFGRYTLLRPLRSGASFPAWLATDRKSGRQVGIWILAPAELTPDLDSRVREDLDNAETITDEGLAAVVLPSVDPAAFSRDAALLERILEQSIDEEDLIDAEDFESIEPVDFKTAAEPPEAEPSRSRTVSGPLVMALFAISIVIAIGVIFYLPDLVSPPEPAATEQAAATPAAAAPAVTAEPEGPKELAPWERAQILKEKEAAEAVLEEFIRKQFDLEETNVAAWGQAELDAAKEDARTGDGHFSVREYEAAQQSYQFGLDKLLALEALAPVLLGESLARGAAALEAFDSATAVEAFTAALAVDPDNAEARAGLKRAQTLDTVQALLVEGRRAEREGELIAARDAFREALNLDPAIAEASEGLRRVEGNIASDQFSIAMSEGYAALSAGRVQQAETAFRRARKLRPGSAEVSEALAQTDMQRRLSRISVLRTEAEQFESEERWADALDRYEQALELDANLAFARHGRTRSHERTELDKRLDEYLAQPQRLSNDAVYAAAEQLLAVADSVAPRGPRLSDQTQKLREALSVAKLPVTVRLESDNKTDVTLFRIGQLGSFASRDIQLRPGTYTVVGTRSGYRDVRRQFTVVPGQPPGTVDVRCEEKI